MNFEIKAVDKTKLYTAIVDQILDGIDRGAFLPGAALPAERVLATQFGVSRSSVREAIRVLEHAGVLDVRTGSGTYVAAGGDSKVAGLRAHAALIGEHSPLDMLIARRALEPVAARMAAELSRPADVTELESIWEQHRELVKRGEDAVDTDLRFHVGVARASHNTVLTLLLEQLVDIMGTGMWRDWKHRARTTPQQADDFLRQHRDVLDGIVRRDPDAAAAAMNAHLDAVDHNLKKAMDHGGFAADTNAPGS